MGIQGEGDLLFVVVQVVGNLLVVGFQVGIADFQVECVLLLGRLLTVIADDFLSVGVLVENVVLLSEATPLSVGAQMVQIV